MKFITEWGMIAGLAGLALGVFLVLFREVIRKKIFTTLTKKQSFIILLVFMILVWSLSAFSIIQYYYGKSGAPAHVTVLVHGEKGKDELVLPQRGLVKLIYGDAIVTATINDRGEATFKQIPPAFFSEEAAAEILFSDPGGEPYRAVHSDSLYRLTRGKHIALAVKLYGLGQFRGVVKDFDTGEPVEGVRVSILGADTLSNRYGEYFLSIPAAHQRKFQTVRAYKTGYQPFELKNVPVQTQNELSILIKPKENVTHRQ